MLALSRANTEARAERYERGNSAGKEYSWIMTVNARGTMVSMEEKRHFGLA